MSDQDIDSLVEWTMCKMCRVTAGASFGAEADAAKGEAGAGAGTGEETDLCVPWSPTSMQSLSADFDTFVGFMGCAVGCGALPGGVRTSEAMSVAVEKGKVALLQRHLQFELDLVYCKDRDSLDTVGKAPPILAPSVSKFRRCSTLYSSGLDRISVTKAVTVAQQPAPVDRAERLEKFNKQMRHFESYDEERATGFDLTSVDWKLVQDPEWDV